MYFSEFFVFYDMFFVVNLICFITCYSCHQIKMFNLVFDSFHYNFELISKINYLHIPILLRRF